MASLPSKGDKIVAKYNIKYGLMGGSEIKAGTIGINCPNTAFPGLPFGGYKQSGFGRENALETLEMYLETKSVLAWIGAKPVNPWGL